MCRSVNNERVAQNRRRWAHLAVALAVVPLFVTIGSVYRQCGGTASIKTKQQSKHELILPEACRAYMVDNHTLSLTHGRYVHVPGRPAPYDHNSCFIMKPRYNCATNSSSPSQPRAYEYKFILQSDVNNASTICDFQQIVNDLGGPAAINTPKQVAIFGNSWMRQVFEAFTCKYRDQLTAAKVTQNPPSVSLAALAARNGTPFSVSEYGCIVDVPVDQRPIPLCAGKSRDYPKYFYHGVELTTPHLTTTCSDELAMAQFGSSLKLYYNFRPRVLENRVESYQMLIGMNVSDLDYIAWNDNAVNDFQSIHTKASFDNYHNVLPHFNKIQKRDAQTWFGATNPWITKYPDSHPCVPGIPDDEAALLLFSILFDIHQFRYT